jgi:hypothetical protein
MTQRGKRIPGDRNPEADPTEAHLIQNAHNASAGASSGDFGIGSAIAAWGRWRQRRRQRKAMSAYEASRREQR